jgi:hypothetical protein
MEYWVQIKHDYCGDPNRGYTQEIKTNHYFRENDDGTILHVHKNISIGFINEHERKHVIKSISQDEFDEVLVDTVNYLGINITNHKFITKLKQEIKELRENKMPLLNNLRREWTLGFRKS